jgi:hypothetical protein
MMGGSRRRRVLNEKIRFWMFSVLSVNSVVKTSFGVFFVGFACHAVASATCAA